MITQSMIKGRWQVWTRRACPRWKSWIINFWSWASWFWNLFQALCWLPKLRYLKESTVVPSQLTTIPLAWNGRFQALRKRMLLSCLVNDQTWVVMQTWWRRSASTLMKYSLEGQMGLWAARAPPPGLASIQPFKKHVFFYSFATLNDCFMYMFLTHVMRDVIWNV